MSNRAYDKQMERENYRQEFGCCECGYVRNGAHHKAIRCPHTGRCGSCGNEWPCEEHSLVRATTIPRIPKSILDSPIMKAMMATHKRNRSFFAPKNVMVSNGRATFFNARGQVCGQMSSRMYGAIKAKYGKKK